MTGTAVLDARGEAGGSRLVPDAQASLAREFANFLLREPGLEQRGGNVVLLCGLLAGAEVALIVKVHAVSDGVEAACGAEFFHHRKKLVFALKAALAIVARIFGAVEFGGGDDFDRNALLVGKGNGIVQLSASQAGRVGDHRQHVCAKSAVGGPGEIRGIHAAGIGDEQSAERSQLCLQLENSLCSRSVSGAGILLSYQPA